jgi:hypothetical protein
MKAVIIDVVYVELLLLAGADPFVQDRSNQIALDYLSPVSQSSIEWVRREHHRKRQLICEAMDKWSQLQTKANLNLFKKFMIARRLRCGLSLQREITDYVIRLSEFDITKSKHSMIALAKSLHIPTTNRTKIELYNEISKYLAIK